MSIKTLSEKRIELHQRLVDIDSNLHVYYQPPESVKLQYPAIVYSRSSIDNTSADDIPYVQQYAYEATVIDNRPDSDIVDKLSKFPKTRFGRVYCSDNLYHTTFTIYY